MQCLFFTIHLSTNNKIHILFILNIYKLKTKNKKTAHSVERYFIHISTLYSVVKQPYHNKHKNQLMFFFNFK